MTEKKELNEQELEKAAGGEFGRYFSSGSKNAGVRETDSCDRFEPSWIYRMFGDSNDKICKNCSHYTPTAPDTPGLGHCLFGSE